MARATTASTAATATTSWRAAPGTTEIIEKGLGQDRIYGGSGNDIIDGNRAADRIFGGTGNDVIHGGPASDVIDCGSGNDTVYLNLDERAGSCRRTARTILDEPDVPSATAAMAVRTRPRRWSAATPTTSATAAAATT